MRVVANPFLTGVLAGFVPAMGLLYVMLHRYEGFFDERLLFRSLLIGLLAGFLVTLGEFFLAPAQTLAPSAAAALFVLGFPALESAVSTAALNRKRFRGRKDTPYYAAAFGLGVGATNALVLAAAADKFAGGEGIFPALGFYAVLVLFTIGVVLVHGAAAVVIGQSTSAGLPFSGMLRGALVLVPFGAIVGSVPLIPLFQAGAGALVAPLAGLAYAAYAARRVQTRILDNVVPDELAQRVRRELRKQMRGEPPAP